MDGLTLTIIFLIISLPFIRYNTVTLFTIFYGTTVIYFISVFLGYYIHANFTSTAVIMDLRETSDVTKYIFLGIIFHLSVFHWFTLKLKIVNPIDDVCTLNMTKILNISAFLMLLMMLLATIKLGSSIFSEQKHDIMDNLGTFYNAKVIFQLFLFSLLLLAKSFSKILWTIVAIGVLFDLFIGFRYTLVFSAIIFFIIKFYGKQISVKKLFYGGIVFTLFFIFFASFGNIRTELRLFDFQAIFVKMSSISWWAYNFTHFEPMHIFAILEGTIESELVCDPVDILVASFVVSFLPFGGQIFELNTFHDCFQPIIFSGFEDISSNPWAEFYSFFGLFGLLYLIWFLCIFLMLCQYLLNNRSLYVLLFIITLLGIFLGYFQRSDFVILMFSVKRVFMGLLILFLLSKIKYPKVFK